MKRNSGALNGAGLGVALIITLIGCITLPGIAADPPGAIRIELSPEVTDLLRKEMSQLSGGLAQLAVAMPSADWDTIRSVGLKMHDSYIMKQSLTSAQATELKQQLPHAFKQRDAAFHRRAKKLAEAAEARDAELVSFHFAKLVEACTGCHADFAQARFPGFASPPRASHSH